MACEKEIHMLHREVEAAKKRYQDLKDEKETLADQQVSSTGKHHCVHQTCDYFAKPCTKIQSVVFQLSATMCMNLICNGSW